VHPGDFPDTLSISTLSLEDTPSISTPSFEDTSRPIINFTSPIVSLLRETLRVADTQVVGSEELYTPRISTGASESRSVAQGNTNLPSVGIFPASLVSNPYPTQWRPRMFDPSSRQSEGSIIARDLQYHAAVTKEALSNDGTGSSVGGLNRQFARPNYRIFIKKPKGRRTTLYH